MTETEVREMCSAEGRRVKVRAMAMARADVRFALHLNVSEQGRGVQLNK